MAKRVGKIALYSFAVFGVFDLLGRMLIFPFSGELFGYALKLPSDVEIQRVVPSPDGSLKAIVYFWSGPPIAAGCGEMIAVVKNWQSATTAWRDTNLVYSAECGGTPVIGWEPTKDGSGGFRLRIHVDPVNAHLVSRFALGGTVGIAYESDP